MYNLETCSLNYIRIMEEKVSSFFYSLYNNYESYVRFLKEVSFNGHFNRNRSWLTFNVRLHDFFMLHGLILSFIPAT